MNVRTKFTFQSYHRLLRIDQQYALLYSEIERYNQQMRSVITGLITGYCIFIAYSIYVLVYTKVSLFFIIPFILCLLSVIFYLTTLIWWCSRLSKMNQQIGLMNDSLLSTIFKKRQHLYFISLIKVCPFFIFVIFS